MWIDWDPEKAKANIRDHHVGFPEAATVLEDEFALTREDPDAHSEQRFITLGLSGLGNLLVVVYTYRVTSHYPHYLGLESKQTSEVTV